MNRPPAEALTDRELEVMHVFWEDGQCTAQEARDCLEKRGRTLTYPTVANLCKILWEKGYLERLGESRPFEFRPTKSFQEVSSLFVADLLNRVFQGSRQKLLLHIVGTKKLTASKRKLLEELLANEEETES
ncbi:BlaI/MecI/CopY family transcriptional regulator [Pirellulaceae bacterium SH449]